MSDVFKYAMCLVDALTELQLADKGSTPVNRILTERYVSVHSHIMSRLVYTGDVPDETEYGE